MAKKLYNKSTYYEPRNCDNCSKKSDCVHLITVKMELVDEWLYGKKFLHLCSDCYIDLKDHKYVRGEIR